MRQLTVRSSISSRRESWHGENLEAFQRLYRANQSIGYLRAQSDAVILGRSGGEWAQLVAQSPLTPNIKAGTQDSKASVPHRIPVSHEKVDFIFFDNFGKISPSFIFFTVKFRKDRRRNRELKLAHRSPRICGRPSTYSSSPSPLSSCLVMSLYKR